MGLKKKPTILDITPVAQSKHFCIEAVDLEFSNGARRTYERMQPGNRDAVLVVPVTEQGDLLLVREYSVGTERYELGFPKGLIDAGEAPEEAANRELKEEIGFGAGKLTALKQVVLAPTYFSSRMTLFIAQELYPETLEGDEPEPLELVRWPLMQADELLTHLDFSEARSIAALMLAQRFLAQSQA